MACKIQFVSEKITLHENFLTKIYYTKETWITLLNQYLLEQIYFMLWNILVLAIQTYFCMRLSVENITIQSYKLINYKVCVDAHLNGLK